MKPAVNYRKTAFFQKNLSYLGFECYFSTILAAHLDSFIDFDGINFQIFRRSGWFKELLASQYLVTLFYF